MFVRQGPGETTPKPRLTLTPADKNPVQLLNELRPGLKYDLEEESGEPHAKKFSMSVMVDGEKFDGVGKWRLASAAAAAIGREDELLRDRALTRQSDGRFPAE